MSVASVRRSVLVLALCQALSWTVMTITIAVTALNGEALATDKTWATLPLGLQAVATMLTTMPASALMRRLGRRFGFSLGSAIGMLGGGLGVLAVAENSFLLLCISNVLIGAMMGFAIFYRFAAADAADEAFRSKAISLVVAGGVVSALTGPTIAQWTVDLFPRHVFAGCYVAMIVLCAGVIGLLRLAEISRATLPTRGSGRPLARIVREPAVIVAFAAGMIGYGVMAFLMTATPLAMTHHHHAFSDWKEVIQWHALGMFAPSFVTGHLIKRFGVLNILSAGAILMFAGVAIDLAGLGFWNFWAGLALIGVGWNFLFIGATTLLSDCYAPAERSKVQGINDFLIFSTVAAASLLSGILHSHFGWAAVNYGVLPLIGATLAATLWLQLRRRKVVPAE